MTGGKHIDQYHEFGPRHSCVCISTITVSPCPPPLTLTPLAPVEGVEWFPAEASPGSIAGRSGPGRECASQAAIFAQLPSGLMMRHDGIPRVVAVSEHRGAALRPPTSSSSSVDALTNAGGITARRRSWQQIAVNQGRFPG